MAIPFSSSTQRGSRKRSYSTSTRGKSVATLRLTENGVFLILDAPYNTEFTESLKKSVPGKKRTWDSNDKVWYIVKDQFDKLTHILDAYYDETLLLDFPAQAVASDAWSKLYLIEGAPVELIQAAYKVLAKKHHPDMGGDTQKMTEINVAYKELMKGLSNGDD